jgi:hypothetical protein
MITIDPSIQKRKTNFKQNRRFLNTSKFGILGKGFHRQAACKEINVNYTAR